ncbi:MAG: ribosomal-processing cysteine protease Prp [Clostridia bacterium]|nr:ribosomal-processing cysteine protease Prp [Clostridia bacterium]
MIDIKISRHNNTITFCAIGHAEHAPYGADIVCAGVSSLVLGLSSALGKKYSHSEISSGRAVIRTRDTREARCYFRFAQKALELICTAYPENVRMSANLS